MVSSSLDIQKINYLEKNVIGTIVPETDSTGRDLREMIIDISKNTENFIINENENMRSNGERLWVAWANRALRDSEGTIVEILCIGNDITDYKIAEQEKEKLEEQYRQSQKMESVGRLAGGVAHDFNNMLSVIIGHTEMILEEHTSTDTFYDNLHAIKSAAVRSADLTRQLLAFARKQTVSPKTINLNVTIQNMLKMLQRLIGEDIEIEWLPSNDLWSVKIDPTQIDQMLVNLSVNARDAINGIGKITIKTKNARLNETYCADRSEFSPGAYILLEVTDNGHGMDSDTLTKIFDPFFTTKEVGEGTGLGLATVYGIVKQNNGCIEAFSEPSKGTSFHIYLPRDMSDLDESEINKSILSVFSGTETILLVEDEPSLLHLSRRILESSGYHVLTALNAEEALKIAKQHRDNIHLLITDIIMPEMNGWDLAAKVKTFQPQLKQIFMSGYTADTIAEKSVIKKDVNFLQKPFMPQSLKEMVRKVLDQK
jgi:signal transduction histidine kinase